MPLPKRVAVKYDLAGRLTTLTPSAASPSSVVTFGYDRVGLIAVARHRMGRSRASSTTLRAASATGTFSCSRAPRPARTDTDHCRERRAVRLRRAEASYLVVRPERGRHDHLRLTTRPGRRHAYEALNRLAAIIDTSTDATIAAYAYDHLYRRVSAV